MQRDTSACSALAACPHTLSPACPSQTPWVVRNRQEIVCGSVPLQAAAWREVGRATPTSHTLTRPPHISVHVACQPASGAHKQTQRAPPSRRACVGSCTPRAPEAHARCAANEMCPQHCLCSKNLILPASRPVHVLTRAGARVPANGGGCSRSQTQSHLKTQGMCQSHSAAPRGTAITLLPPPLHTNVHPTRRVGPLRLPQPACCPPASSCPPRVTAHAPAPCADTAPLSAPRSSPHPIE